MIIDTVDTSNLGNSAEEAFVEFEQRLRAALEDEKRWDREQNQDHNGNYYGSYEPDRFYVSSILAFLDEYDLDIEINDISEAEDHDFRSCFSQFFSKINYAKTRFALRIQRIDTGSAGTPILILESYKDDIHKNLDTIRKIVNQQVKDNNKKDAIFTKIASLQSEIDRERTTIDMIFGRIIDLSKVIGECAENMDPAVQKLERVMKALKDGTERVKLLPTRNRPKLKPPKKVTEEADDEIPF